MIIPERLKPGDMIGLAAPCHLAEKERYQPMIEALEKLGYRVRCAQNMFASGWNYIASDVERASDINELIRDPEVKMILFGGGEGADDVLDLIDYEAAKSSPKIYLSYSDGTSILNSIWHHTGIVTYYGQMPSITLDPSAYNLEQFKRHIVSHAMEHTNAAAWHVVRTGKAAGILVGGYLDNFLYLIGKGTIPMDESQRYILFLEDHEKYSDFRHVSVLLGRLEQSGIMSRVKGVLFGHYSNPINEYLLERLTRLAEKWQIPTAYCDDFGHGANHAILPIGAAAVLDTTLCSLLYHYNQDV